MHPAVLATSGYALLVSSIVSLIILLRKNGKRCVRSSLHMLAMSDILSTVLTAVLLIINQRDHSSNGPFDDDRINVTVSETWMKFANMDERAFVRPFGAVNFSDDRTNVNFNVSNSCTINDVIMHYSMFLFPFVNAFVSLLSFSALSNVDVDYVSTKCARIIEAAGSAVKIPGGNNDKSDRSRNEREITVTGVGIAGQWLLPVLMTAVLRFAGHESPENMQRSGDMGCVYGTNFPLENCGTIDGTTGVEFFNGTENIAGLAGDYLDGLDSLRISEANFTDNDDGELADVVSKVYQIVGSLRNFTVNETADTSRPTFYEPSRILNITTFMGMKSSTENYNEAVPSASSIRKPEIDEDEETELFESLMENSSNGFHDQTNLTEIPRQSEKTNAEIPQVADLSRDISNKIAHTVEDDIQSDGKILADLVKKIQAVTMQLQARDAKQLEKNTKRTRSQRLKDGSKVFSTADIRPEGTLMCAKKQCFVSTRFLKIHLLVLVFLVYFIPIFVCAILYTRVEYACRNIKEKMEMRVIAEAAAVESTEASVHEKMEGASGPSGWFAAEATDGNEISGGSLEDLVGSGVLKEADRSEVQSVRRATDDSDALRTMDREMRGMEKLSKLFKTSLLFAVLLWTPTFLEVLAKVFLCVNCVDWLMNASFVGALLFGALRNVLDLRMIGAREILRNNDSNKNRVGPDC